MRPRASVLALLALLLAPPLAAAAIGTPGPFAGAVRDDETRTHAYDGSPLGMPCPAFVVLHTVQLDWAPGSDALVLSVPGRGSVGATGGHVELSFHASACTAFTVHVHGAEVRAVAAYTVRVVSGSPYA